MTLVSVDRALEELQNDILFVRLYLILLHIQIQTLEVLNSLLEKRVSFCSSLKALSTDTSFIKIRFCCQKLLTLEFNFHCRLSSHCDQKEGNNTNYCQLEMKYAFMSHSNFKYLAKKWRSLFIIHSYLKAIAKVHAYIQISKWHWKVIKDNDSALL